MKVDCPSCSGRLEADDLDLRTQLGKCRYCGELNSLRELLGERSPRVSSRASSADRVSSNSEPQGRVEKPFNSKIEVEEQSGVTTFRLPASGFRGPGIGMVLFSIPWLAFVAFWTAGASGLLFGGNGPGGWFGILFPMFSIPFWCVGFGMLFGPLYAMTTSRRVRIGPVECEFRTGTIFGPRLRRMDRGDIQAVREKSLVKSGRGNGAPDLMAGLEIVHRGGTYVLPVSDAVEKRWLLGEIWHALE
ncbi:MAG: hypothetical protein AAGJ97_06365, partial [Planctomycetota bacterium]